MDWEIWGDGDDDPELLRYQRQRQREAQRRRLWLQRQAEIDQERRRQQELQHRRHIWILQQQEAEEARRREDEAWLQAELDAIAAKMKEEFVAQKTALHNDFVLQIPVDTDLGIASSQIPCVDNFEIFPTVGHTLPESPNKASESDLQVTSKSAQDVLNVSKDVNEVFFAVFEPKEVIVAVIVEKDRVFKETVVFEVAQPRILLAVPPYVPSFAPIMAIAPLVLSNDSIRGRIENKWGRMMHSRFRDPLLKANKKAPPWIPTLKTMVCS